MVKIIASMTTALESLAVPKLCKLDIQYAIHE